MLDYYGLKPEEAALVNQEVAMHQKNKNVMVLLWFFTSGLAGHRFYLGNTGYAVLMLLFGWCTFFVWNLVDLLFAAKELEKQNNRLRQRSIDNVKYMRSAHETNQNETP